MQHCCRCHDDVHVCQLKAGLMLSSARKRFALPAAVRASLVTFVESTRAKLVSLYYMVSSLE